MGKFTYAFFLTWMFGLLAVGLWSQRGLSLLHVIFLSALSLGFLLCLIDEPKGVFALLCILPLVLFALVFGSLFGAPYPSPIAILFVIGTIAQLAGRRQQLRSTRVF